MRDKPQIIAYRDRLQSFRAQTHSTANRIVMGSFRTDDIGAYRRLAANQSRHCFKNLF